MYLHMYTIVFLYIHLRCYKNMDFVHAALSTYVYVNKYKVRLAMQQSKYKGLFLPSFITIPIRRTFFGVITHTRQWYAVFPLMCVSLLSGEDTC